MQVSHVIAGSIAVLVGYAGSAAIIFQASAAAGASPAQAASWMLALGLGCAFSSVYLSLRHRIPVLTAWSTPGAALLAVSLPGIPLAEATAAFLLCGALLVLTGLTPWFARLIRRVPDALANAMLAGVLFQFGLSVFTSLQLAPAVVAPMALSYIAARRWAPRMAIPLVLIVGLLVTISRGQFPDFSAIPLTMAQPLFVMPEVNLSVLLGVGLPLFLVTMSSQNLPGIAVLRAAGYEPPVASALKVTGGATLVLAPFGGFAFNLAAITAAICANEEAGADPKSRFWAPVVSGVAYAILALFGTTVIGFFLAAPTAFVAALAGLALLPVIASSLTGAMAAPQSREAALVTFLTTVSGISFFGVAAPVWGLLFGGLILVLRKPT
ncbi:benzoate/H(+) symporter BenE family transporter [Cognatishimia sp. SS12]|uniref:benzoate/H(+) symporter BenE family transporter n=1 Tax=Cognatishimia sp. SS12 TaxID=2979465 RepID=UPI00232D9572|nr:benzoate/H(+) symporter BenE family transporter [Cognatishimia sp. SS12]MDC0739279.1 benzoate/H(+) symporter BenE family transporter [Cognatishimia sp. SS12]